MIRQFGPAEALFIIEAVRWTLLLSAVAFIGGGIGGLGVALARTAPPAWLRLARHRPISSCSRARRC